MLKVYSLRNCPACEALKNRLRSYNVEFNEIVIGEQVSREQVIAMFPHARTAPIITDGQSSQPMNEAALSTYLSGRLLTE